MSKKIHVVDLGNREGRLEYEVEKESIIGLREIKEKRAVGNTNLVHGPYCGGRMKIVKVSDNKTVLCCIVCAHRSEYSVAAEKIGDLVPHIEMASKGRENT